MSQKVLGVANPFVLLYPLGFYLRGTELERLIAANIAETEYCIVLLGLFSWLCVLESKSDYFLSV